MPECRLGGGLVPAAAHAGSPGRKDLLRGRAFCGRRSPSLAAAMGFRKRDLPPATLTAPRSVQSVAPGFQLDPERLLPWTRLWALGPPLRAYSVGLSYGAARKGPRIPAEKGYRPIRRHQQPENLQQDFQGNAVAPARVGLLQRCGRGRGTGLGLGRAGPRGPQPPSLAGDASLRAEAGGPRTWQHQQHAVRLQQVVP